MVRITDLLALLLGKGERGLFFVLNTDDNAVPFIHPQAGVDITEPVLARLGIVTTALPTTPNPQP